MLKHPFRTPLYLSVMWVCWLTGSLAPYSGIASADISSPDARWYYDQRGELLDSETFGGAIDPMQFPNYSEDKTVYFPPFQFYAGGSAQTLTHTLFAGGKYPSIDSQLETTWDNVAWVPERDASVSSNMQYNFQAWKKVAWAPEWDVPVTALISVNASAYGPKAFMQPRPSRAYAEADLTYRTGSGTYTESVVIDTLVDGNSDKQLFKKFAVGLDLINEVTLATNVLATGYGGDYISGTWGAKAIADPAIQIDPDAFIEVNGTNYKASELYGLSFSPGFQAVPEPGAGLSLSLLLISVAAMKRRPRAKR